MTQLVCSVKGSEKCVWSWKKASCSSVPHHPCRLHLGSGTTHVCTWWWQSGMTEELLTTRNDPLVWDVMLPKNLPSFIVLCMIADNEMLCTFVTLLNIKETFIYLCLENHREIGIKENLLLKAFDVIKDEEYLAGALKGENLTGVQLLLVQPCSLQFKCSKSTIIMHWGIQSINWCFVFSFFWLL